MLETAEHRVQRFAESREQRSASAAAYQAARARLIEAHRIEYDAYHREERVKRGLPALPNSGTIEAMQRRIVELEAQLEQREASA